MSTFSSSPVPGAPTTVPGAPSIVPGSASARPPSGQSVNLLSNDKIELSTGFVKVDWSGFFTINTNTKKIAASVEDLRHKVCKQLAQSMQDWARANAPWQDQTGDARHGLEGEYIAESGINQSSAIITHTVPYGIFLETMQGGSFQIILPTLLHFAAEVGRIETEEGFEFESSGTRIT